MPPEILEDLTFNLSLRPSTAPPSHARRRPRSRRRLRGVGVDSPEVGALGGGRG
ncbi:hypothetical protein LV779_13920 [Streptomyces thinghirensis]|nr:hypothetical protein [Streptomyces thinghirensis]